MKIAIVGLDGAGLVTAACLADIGHDVCAFDPVPAVCADARSGALDRAEPGLASLIEANQRRQRLSFSPRLGRALAGAEAVFLAIEPAIGADGREDCAAIRAMAQAVAEGLQGDALIVLHAALPVGVGDRIEAEVRAARPDLNLSVVSNPPFQRPGTAVLDLMRADRIVIGASDSDARRRMGLIFRPLCNDDVPLVYTSRRTAEMIKYASNAYVAMKRTLVSELSTLCAVAGADINDLARGIDLDSRLGPAFLALPPAAEDAPTFPGELLALVRAVGDIEAAAPVRREEPRRQEPRRQEPLRNAGGLV